MNTSRLFALWESLEVPRAATAVAVAVYISSTLAGVMFATDAAWAGLDAAQVWLRALCVLLLVGGGAVGVPAAWRGLYWLERGAALSVAFGTLLLASNVYVLAPSVWPLMTHFLVMSLGFLTHRLIRVMRSPFEPGKGPLLPGQLAQIDAANRNA